MMGLSSIDGFRARVKIFDYGVVSLALTKPFAGSWQEHVEVSQSASRTTCSSRAEKPAGSGARTLRRRYPPARKYLNRGLPGRSSCTGLATPREADSSCRARRRIAQLLRGERSR